MKKMKFLDKGFITRKLYTNRQIFQDQKAGFLILLLI
jgi:hypothetical protein